MFNKILVALDTSETCTDLFDKALALAQATGAELTLFSVLTPSYDYMMSMPYSPMGTGYPMTVDDTVWKVYQEECREYQARGREMLSRWCDQGIGKGVHTRFVQVSGEPGRAICDRAKADNVDLIIVGSHGRRGLSEFLIGSVSSYVMHRAPCSVMVVHHAAELLPKETRETFMSAASDCQTRN